MCLKEAYIQMRAKWVLPITLLMAWPAVAQYSPARLLNPEPVTLKGIVTQVEWINPHVWIHLAVTSSDGAIANWLIALASLGGLAHAGASKDSLKQGDIVSVEVFALRDGSQRAEAKQGGSLTLANGQKVRIPAWWRSIGPKLIPVVR